MLMLMKYFFYRVSKERLEIMENLDHPVQPDNPVSLVHLEVREGMEFLEHPDLKVDKERRETQVFKDLLELVERMELM